MQNRNNRYKANLNFKKIPTCRTTDLSKLINIVKTFSERDTRNLVHYIYVYTYIQYICSTDAYTYICIYMYDQKYIYIQTLIKTKIGL